LLVVTDLLGLSVRFDFATSSSSGVRGGGDLRDGHVDGEAEFESAVASGDAQVGALEGGELGGCVEDDDGDVGDLAGGGVLVSSDLRILDLYGYGREASQFEG
jgi:hypothetical protein